MRSDLRIAKLRELGGAICLEPPSPIIDFPLGLFLRLTITLLKETEQFGIFSVKERSPEMRIMAMISRRSTFSNPYACKNFSDDEHLRAVFSDAISTIFKMSHRWSGEKRQCENRIELTTRAQPLGGRRWWLVCTSRGRLQVSSLRIERVIRRRARGRP
jgi:hypothetical protein